jgi:hypothetical protein
MKSEALSANALNSRLKEKSISRRWELNPQPPLYESGALPLSYFGENSDGKTSP